MNFLVGRRTPDQWNKLSMKAVESLSLVVVESGAIFAKYGLGLVECFSTISPQTRNHTAPPIPSQSSGSVSFDLARSCCLYFSIDGCKNKMSHSSPPPPKKTPFCWVKGTLQAMKFLGNMIVRDSFWCMRTFWEWHMITVYFAKRGYGWGWGGESDLFGF